MFWLLSFLLEGLKATRMMYSPTVRDSWCKHDVGTFNCSTPTEYWRAPKNTVQLDFCLELGLSLHYNILWQLFNFKRKTGKTGRRLFALAHAVCTCADSHTYTLSRVSEVYPDPNIYQLALFSEWYRSSVIYTCSCHRGRNSLLWTPPSTCFVV